MASYTPEYMLRTAMAGSTAGSSEASGATTIKPKKSKGSKGMLSGHEVVKAIMASDKSHADKAAVLKLLAGGGGGKAKRKRRTPLELDDATREEMRSETIEYYKTLANITEKSHRKYLGAKIDAEHTMCKNKYEIIRKWVTNNYPVMPPAPAKGLSLNEEQKKAQKAYGVVSRLYKRMFKLDLNGKNIVLEKYEHYYSQDNGKYLSDQHFLTLKPILKKYYLAKANALAEDDTKKRREALRAALKEKKQEMAGWRQHHNIAPRQKPPRQMRQSLAFQAGLFDLHESCEDTDDDDY